MNTNEAKQQVKTTFTQPFNESVFKTFSKNLLKDLDESKEQTFSGAYIKDAFKPHVTSYKRLGSYVDENNETLDVLTVKLADFKKLDRARTMQRNFISDYLRTRGEKDSAIVAFYNEDYSDWRFSYVRMEYKIEMSDKGQIKIKEELTPARRYSFLVGENEPNHTAQQQIAPLFDCKHSDGKLSLSEIEDAFRIESVTKEFFSKYKDLFLKLKDEIDDIITKDANIAKDFEDHEISTANFAKKLMGQIVFLYFVQKKGWMGVAKDANWGDGKRGFLSDLFKECKKEGKNYFNDYLEHLFYDALNNENRGTADPSYHPRFKCKIPFLNGGLFEPMNGYDWEHTELKIENDIFAEILKTFDLYNFTVREDEPLEKEVAVDPEMLGKVFENLLEVTDRKSKGAFYTPREIVHYMCQESLINYLDSKLNTTHNVAQASRLRPQCNSTVSVENNHKRDACATLVPFDYGNPLSVTERNLPHWQQPATSYFITFRLADSIPASIVEKIKKEREIWLQQHEEPYSDEDWLEYNKLFSEKIQNLLDAGSGSCILKDIEISNIVKNALTHFDGERYDLGEWIIMPNHVHVIVTPFESHSIDKITHSWKSFTAHEMNKKLERTGNIWQHESFDHIIRNEKQLHFIGQYILDNPAKAKLNTAQFQCSSSVSLETQCNSTVPVETLNVAHASRLSNIHNRDGCATLKSDIEEFIRRGDIYIDYAVRNEAKRKQGDNVTGIYKQRELPDSIIKNATEIDALLNDIKICDPAIGSGAFPVGMMNEIVRARYALSAYGEPDPNRTPYVFKRQCIQDCIYGVDIDSGAIDIAKLRLWLSLVVDEDDFNEIQPLPNLDYKIMQGNSLLEEYEGIKLFDGGLLADKNEEIENDINSLTSTRKNIEKEYLSLHTENKLTDSRKGLLDKEVKKIDKQIKKLRDSQKKDENSDALGLFDKSEAKKKAEQLEYLHEKFFDATEKDKKEEYRIKIEKLEWELIEVTLKEKNQTDALANIASLKKSKTKPFFLWKLYFAEVFKQNKGFDIVIGNPPYIQIQKFSGQQIQKDLENANFATFAKTGDIYSLFYEKGWQIARPGGHVCLITSNKWMRANYGKATRKFFTEKTNPVQIIDFGGYKVFDSATVDTNILIFQKCSSSVPLETQCNSTVSVDNLHKRDACATLACSIGKDFKSHNRDACATLPEYFTKNSIALDNLSEDSWIISSKEEYAIKRKIEAVGTPLKDWDISMNFGIKTGFNEAFIISEEKKDKLIAKDSASAEILKPLLRGRDIQKYSASFANVWLISTFPALNININDYPAVKEYLEQFLPKLKQTGETYIDNDGEKQKTRKKTVNKWFETQDPITFYKDFENEKVVWKRIGSIIRFAYSLDSELCLDSTVNR